MRLRDIAASLGTTERSMYGTVADLATASYVVKQKNGRRNRCQLQAHLPQPEPGSQEHTAGDVLALLAGTDARRNSGASNSGKSNPAKAMQQAFSQAVPARVIRSSGVRWRVSVQRDPVGEGRAWTGVPAVWRE